MKSAFGVPLSGGHSDVVRERASATPLARSVETTTGHAPSLRAATKPVRASLRSLQEWLAAAVTHPTSVGESVRERGTIGDEPLGVDDAERVVLPSSHLSGLERIGIYHAAYRARLVECLADDYPAMQYALGESGFENLCLAYIAAHPSQSPNLNAFGRHMSAFCGARAESAAAFLADLASLEWALVEVVHAAPAESLTEDALSTIAPADWVRARFAPSEIVRILELCHPVNAYFQAFNTGERPEPPAPGWSATAIFRERETIWRMDMSRSMHTLLRALFDGATLGDALEGVASTGQLTEDEAPVVMRWFRDWVRYGFFATIAV